MSVGIREKRQQLANLFKSKLDKIKVCAFDVDGILTNGLVYWAGAEVGWNRFSHTRDGYGLKILMEMGIKVGVITGGNSLGVVKRFKENLGLDFVYMGNEDKRQAYLDLLSQGYKDEEIFYMGDELFDLPLIRRSGFSATVPSASHEVLEAVDLITEHDSGMGCVREVVDLIRLSRGFTPAIPDFDEGF